MKENLKLKWQEKKEAVKAKRPTQVKDKLKSLKEQFSQNKILKSLAKYFAIGAVVTTIFVAFKDSLAEWAKGLWETIKEKFDEFVGDIKTWFQDSVQPIIDGIKEYLQPVIDAISGLFKSVGDWFVEKFNMIKEIAEGPLNFVKKVIDKVLDAISSLLDKLPDWVKDKLGIKKKVEAPKGPDQTENEIRKLKRQQDEALETERVKKLEKEKQYTGTDEIVRERLGLPPKTETMRREEAAKAAKPIEAAPRPEPILTPGPMPTLPAAEAKPPAEAPAKPPPAAVPAPTPAPKAEKEAVAPSPSDTKPVKISASTGKSAMLKAMDDNKITDPTQRAAIMAQVGHESGGFTTLSENLNYKGSSLMKLFKKYFGSQQEADQVAAKGPAAIADRIYGGRMGNAPEGSGEGFKYRGRGFVQLTGKSNYKKFGFESNPDEVASVQNAADTAIKYMMGYKGDWSDIVKVTKFVNGGTIGLEDRKKHFEEYLKDPSIIKVGAVQTAVAGGGVASTSSEVASGQRAQAKPTTPMIVNAPTTNNQTVTQNQVQPRKQEYAGSAIAARVA